MMHADYGEGLQDVLMLLEPSRPRRLSCGSGHYTAVPPLVHSRSAPMPVLLLYMRACMELRMLC